METSLAVDRVYITFLKKTNYFLPIWQRPSRCVLTNLHNILYTVSTQQYINTVILYIHSDHVTATCFDRNRSSSGQQKTFLRYNKLNEMGSHWDSPSFFEISYLNTILQKTRCFVRGFNTNNFISDVRGLVIDRGLNKLRSGRSRFRIPTGKRLFYLLQIICGFQTASYSVGTWKFFACKLAGAWNWPVLFSFGFKSGWNYTPFLPLCLHGVERRLSRVSKLKKKTTTN